MSAKGCSSSDWVPWTIREGLPEAIPGCQNVEALPPLGEGRLICGDGDFCYNYRCIKCMPIYALDYYNGEHKKQLVILPPISSIKPSKPSLFSTDHGYEGEVVEFYDNYLSRMTGLTGIAINGWKSEQATLIFDSVENSFDGTRYKKSKNFEIDWLFMNGSVLTVVEIGVRGENEEKDKSAKKGKTEQSAEDGDDADKGVLRLISRKIDQLIQDQVVIQHLLEATNVQNCCINYFAVWPNIPIEEIKLKIETTYRRALDEMCFSGGVNQVQFGVISSNSIPDKSVYLYGGGGELCQPMKFEDLIMTSYTGWCSDQRYMASLVAASVMKADTVTKVTAKMQTKSNKEEFASLLSIYWKSKEEEKIRTRAMKAVGVTAETKKKNRSFSFPADLIFGPEQLTAILSESRVTLFLLTGEAGCGKTTTLLAILFKHAGKHVSEKNRKKVVFFIPQEKKDLRRDIQNFVYQNCLPEWVQLCPLHCLDTTLINTANIYLIDEFYGRGPELTKKLIFSRGTFYIATISTESRYGSLLSGFSKDVQIMYFRRLYRSTSEISKVCAKLRRLMDKKVDPDSHMNIPWAMSFYNGPPMQERNSIEVSSYSGNQNITANIPKMYYPKIGRGTLLISWRIDAEIALDIDTYFPEYNIYHVTADDKLSVDDLHFTGSEFRNVIVVLGESVEPQSDCTTLLLYNSVTRATERVHVLCSTKIESEIASILSLSTNNDIIFEKLRSVDNLGSELFSNITDPVDRLEVMKRIVATKNEAQFKLLNENGFFDIQNFSEAEKELIQCMKIMIDSPTNFQPLVDLLLLEKKMPWLDCPTLEDARPVISLFEPLRVNLTSERRQTRELTFANQIEQIEIFNVFMQKYYPTDMRFVFADRIRTLTKGNDSQISDVLSQFDTKKVEQIFKSFIHLVSGTGKTEILRNLVLLLRKKRFFKHLFEFSVNVPQTFTEKLEDDGSTLLHKYAQGSNQRSFHRLLDLLPEDRVWFSEDRLLDNCLQNPLMTAIGNTEAFVMITQRAKRQGDLDHLLAHRDIFGWSCLRWACRVDNLKVVKALIENKDMSLDWTEDLDPDGRTLIHLVCVIGHTHILRYLLTLDEKQAEPFKVTKATAILGMTCLHAACMFGRAEVVRMLIETVPDLVLTHFQGINCLTLASHCIFKDKDCIVNLLNDKLPIQQLDDVQEDLVLFMRNKTRNLNHNNFVDEKETSKFHLRSFYILFLFLFHLKCENDLSAKPPNFTIDCYIC